MNDQIIIAKKDKERAENRHNQASVLSLISKITVEDIFRWIRKGYLETKDDTTFIQRSFVCSGMISTTSTQQPLAQGNEMDIEDNVDATDNIIDQEEEEIDHELSPILIDDRESDDEALVHEDLLFDEEPSARIADLTPFEQRGYIEQLRLHQSSFYDSNSLSDYSSTNSFWNMYC